MPVLTDTALRAVPVPSKGRVELADQRCAGLAFRVTPNGVRSFSFRYRDPVTGRLERLTLGKYPTLSLGTARARADELRVQVAKGENPQQIKKQERSGAIARTFGAVADRYISEYARRHKRSAGEDERNLKKHVRPAWELRDIRSIERGDVIELLEKIVASGAPVQANRVQSLVSKVFSFAQDVGIRPDHPCLRLKKRSAETPRNRVLTDNEIRLFWGRALAAPLSPRTGLPLRLMLLTGMRPGEAAGISRSELLHLDNPDSAALLLPAARTKNRRALLVPLTPLAVRVIQSALDLIDEKQALLFPSPKDATKPVDAHSLTVALDRFAGKKKTSSKRPKPKTVYRLTGVGAETWVLNPPSPHDLRRTVETRLAAQGTPKEIRDRILNHVQGDTGSRHYNQYDYYLEKRAALLAWESNLSAILGAGGDA